jgi:hypothetical protein
MNKWVMNRTVHVVNLDPAAEHFEYPVAIDIRDLISLEDVMEEMDLGPNGGLVYCMEYLVSHLDWLSEQIQDFGGTSIHLVTSAHGLVVCYHR